MLIKHEYPPNYKEICEHFDIKGKKHVVFTYGDTVYIPSGINLSFDVMTHEEVHEAQQAFIGGPEIWWETYFKDPQFRLEQELEAYRRQYKCMPTRDQRRKVLQRISRDLSGVMYGNILTRDEAKELIKQ